MEMEPSSSENSFLEPRRSTSISEQPEMIKMVVQQASNNYSRNEILKPVDTEATNRIRQFQIITTTSSRKVKLYKILDVIASLVVVLPLTIAFWRGVWQLMDEYSKGLGGPFFSIIIGNLICLSLYFFQEPLKCYINPKRVNYVTFYIVTRILLLLHSFGSVNQWRGLWWVFYD